MPDQDRTPNESDVLRYRELFDKLDRNRVGSVGVTELRKFFVEYNISHACGQADALVQRTGLDKSGSFNYDQFVSYMLNHERELRDAFTHLDRDRDGMIDASEVRKAFAEHGMRLTSENVRSLMRGMNRDERIDYETWRNFFLLQPSATLGNIMHFWQHSVAIDVGEDVLLPDDFSEEEIKTGYWWRSLLAGGLAGGVSRTCTAPLDRVKVIMQVYGNKHKNVTIAGGLRHMLLEGGWPALWRGNMMNVIKIAPESAIKFFAYEKFKAFIKLLHHDQNTELRMSERFLAGSMAGITSQSVIYPLEVLKTRMTVRKTGDYSGVRDCARKLYGEQGVRAFYRGYVPNALGIIPYAGIDLCVYETLKLLYAKRIEASNAAANGNSNSNGNGNGNGNAKQGNGKGNAKQGNGNGNAKQGSKPDTPLYVRLLCGAISSTCGQLASYPLALIRTRMQARPNHVSETKFWVMLRSIVRHEGVRGLYRGLAPNFLKVAPAVSISYAVYEEARKALGINAM